MKELTEINYVFFGTGPLAEHSLITLLEAKVIPKYIVTKPNRTIPGSSKAQEPRIATLARTYGISVLQPEKVLEIRDTLTDVDADVFIVASYGKILPQSIIDIPAFGTLNIHPSLLPHYRGPTPIETALLHGDEHFGVTIMFMDEEMDHGPVLAQHEYDDFTAMPTATAESFEKLGGIYGASLLLTEVLLPFTRGSLIAEEQNHEQATYTKKFTKETGLVSLSDTPEQILHVYRACTPWPGCFFIHNHNGKDIRVKISEMDIVGGVPTITKVIPEGKKEMTYEAFTHGYLQN